MLSRSRVGSIVSCVVSVHPHEISPLVHSAACFFFVLSAYFVVLPLRDDGAISLGLNNFPELFVGSFVLTLIAAPISTFVFSLPNISKAKADYAAFFNDVILKHDLEVPIGSNEQEGYEGLRDHPLGSL